MERRAAGFGRLIRGQGGRLVALALLMFAVVLLHYTIPTTTHSQHQLHIIARKLYYLPPVLAAAWFGMRGAIRSTFVMSALFVLHALRDWPANFMERSNQLGELNALWVVGFLAGHFFARERALLEDIAAANEETVAGLVSALDLREHDTGMHSHRVREYAVLVADRFGIDDAHRRAIAYGALLHDVGKIAVPDHILLKPGPLSPDEVAVMHQHPESGYRIVSQVPFLSGAAEIVLAHHERFDGAGYPRGLQRDGIPLGARLFAVADAYDALTSRRPYRAAATHAVAVAEIRAGAGGQFDPEVVAVFTAVPESELRRVTRGMHGEVHTVSRLPAITSDSPRAS